MLQGRWNQRNFHYVPANVDGDFTWRLAEQWSASSIKLQQPDHSVANGMGGVNITRPTSATNKFGIIRSINSQCTLSLFGMSISNGYALSTAGGGGLYATGNIVAENSIISGNSARAPGSGTTHGGGIVASSVSLMSSVVSGNQQLGFGTGGGVVCRYGFTHRHQRDR